MFKRLRTTSTAGSGALLLVLALSGVVAGASFLAATGPSQETADPEVVDTTATWQDANANGIDDDCEEEAVVADPDAEALADAAVDTDGDGVISVTEAAHSDRVGGANCNHGGYVTFVTHGVEPTDEDAEEALNDAECEVVAAPEPDATITTPNAHGTWISQVAQSDAIGGKNCNHGGAVSDANKAAREAREAAKDVRAAERDAAKAERAAKRAAARAERSAAKADKPSTAAKAAKPDKADKADKADRAAKPAKTKSNGH